MHNNAVSSVKRYSEAMAVVYGNNLEIGGDRQSDLLSWSHIPPTKGLLIFTLKFLHLNLIFEKGIS